VRYVRTVPETDAERFRQQAEECRQLAAESVSPLDREYWLGLAADWLKLAADAEKGRGRFWGRFSAHAGSDNPHKPPFPIPK
jgi:hypothetical protein